jgi:plastocyanin
VPKAKAIAMDADPVCAGKHTSGPVYPESLVVKADGSLKNVFVYVSKGLEGKTFPTPSEPVVLDQDGCMYKPHVFGIMPGQQLKVVNSDDTTHNVHALAETNEEFNVGQRKGQAPILKTFSKPEVTVPLVCNQHPWMKAMAHVISNPYFAVSDADGAFELKGLPPGKYTVTAIHEKYGSMTQEVTVVAGKPVAPLTFTFSAAHAYQPSPLKTMPAVMIQ